ncbi:MAG: dCTP deaminase domain-containing protein [Conexivisphaera sp.]
MCVIGHDEFIKLNERYMIIHPFNAELMDGDGYVLTVKDDVEIRYLEHRNLVSHEIVFVPPDYVAHLTAKSRFGRLGLSFLNAAKVHSGFVGRLALEVVNLNNERDTVTVRRGEPFMHFELMRREGPPRPYQGRYTFQFMDDMEVELYLKLIERELSGVMNLRTLKELAAGRIRSVEEIRADRQEAHARREALHKVR